MRCFRFLYPSTFLKSDGHFDGQYSFKLKIGYYLVEMRVLNDKKKKTFLRSKSTLYRENLRPRLKF